MIRFLSLILGGALCLSAQIRLGIVGTDTSHVVAFTKVLNDPSNPDHIEGAKIVAAYKGGSKDIPDSANRVDKFAAELSGTWKIEMMPDIPSLCSKVDGILLESVDGRKHLEQARQVIACKKPMFIDKPLASTLEDAREIAKLAKAAGVPWFSTSSLRYGQVATTMKFEDATGAITWGPGPLEEHHHLELAWYAIHPVEMLFTLLGAGCEEVTRTSSQHAEEVTCRWKDGRLGTVRAVRPYSDYGAVVFRPKEIVQSPPKAKSSYVPMLKEIVKFFQTKQPPVPNEETMEIYAFLDAAQRSKAAGGKPMRLR